MYFYKMLCTADLEKKNVIVTHTLYSEMLRSKEV